MQESKHFGLVDYVKDITTERSVGMANMDCFSCGSGGWKEVQDGWDGLWLDDETS